MADAPDTTKVPSPDELLAREDAGRNRAGLAGLAAAIIVTFAFLVQQVVSGKAPSITITQALRDAAGEGDTKNGLLAAWIDYQHDKLGLLSLGALFQVLGVIGFGILLLFLFDAAKGRRPEAPGWVKWLLFAGIAATVIGAFMVTIGDGLAYKDFVDGADHSSKAARDAYNNTGHDIGGVVSYFGEFLVVLAWVMVSLNAMRVGLLTRFLGFLGILGGIITFFLAQLPVIEIFWLVATGVTVLGKSPGGTPPAWKTGKSEPWPTQQDAREARERARQGKSSPAGKPAKSPKTEPEAVPSPATSARKRKRRS